MRAPVVAGRRAGKGRDDATRAPRLPTGATRGAAVRSAYDLLGVTPDTPLDAAERAYREQRERISSTPPMDADAAARHNEQLAAVDWAWRTLSDENLRRQHDAW